ncbi:hypothetical protein [Delftia lacustris]|jgi:hypothetical protein|uniref:DUF5983 family protein n=1 Tax=Delftia lacustris TaxID=558537 RepID=UPI001FCB119D|nr:hypothetical protein [Delftia lacustris]BDE73694.1 hypothetical protein HQS1_48180 [Delftia lacustris]
METDCIEGLREQAESLVALSLSHLTPATQERLQADDLSVNAYPTDFGGFVYVGAPRHRHPAEADLASIFEAAEQAGVHLISVSKVTVRIASNGADLAA